MKSIAPLPELPVLDDALCIEARRLAGAHVHDVTSIIAFYEDNLAGAKRMAERARLGGEDCAAAREDLEGRIRLASAFETRLRTFVAQARQAAVPS